MMDPLSLSCSIIALLTTSAQLGSALYFFASSTSDVPNIIVRVTSETQALTAIFGQLQTLILKNGRKPGENRLSLVSLDQLVTILTGCMCTYSELEKELADGQSGKEIENTLRIWDRVKWAMKTPELQRLLGDLQQHKLNLNLMLGIMHCHSNDEASKKLESLCAAVQDLVESHRRISAQLRAIMNSPNAPHIDNDDDNDDGDTGTILGISTEVNTETLNEDTASILTESTTHTLKMSFESVLHKTRVYKHAHIWDRSFTPQSSVKGHTRWSTLSDLSIADVISNRSVISLPLWPQDIWNLGSSYLEPITEVSPSSALVSGRLPPSSDLSYFDSHSTAVDQSIGVALSTPDTLPSQAEDEGSSVLQTPIIAPSLIESLLGGHNLPADSSLPTNSEAALAPPVSSPDDSDSDDIFPCKGCGMILDEGKAFELAGNRWHLECFKCNSCNKHLDSDANLLLLGDGSLICNNCTYKCTACSKKIEDLAILTGDQAFCESCFKCRNCKRKIENLKYARTSQGIFCMSCHETLMARRKKRSKKPKIPDVDRSPSLPSTFDIITTKTPEVQLQVEVDASTEPGSEIEDKQPITTPTVSEVAIGKQLVGFEWI